MLHYCAAPSSSCGLQRQPLTVPALNSSTAICPALSRTKRCAHIKKEPIQECCVSHTPELTIGLTAYNVLLGSAECERLLQSAEGPPVLVQVDALPGAQCETALCDRERQRGAHQRTLKAAAAAATATADDARYRVAAGAAGAGVSSSRISSSSSRQRQIAGSRQQQMRQLHHVGSWQQQRDRHDFCMQNTSHWHSMNTAAASFSKMHSATASQLYVITCYIML
jgi:hypothetical protein